MLLLVGFGLGALIADRHGDSGAAAVDDQGVPKGLPRTQAGAVDAAATYTSLFSLDVVLDEERAASLADSIATPAYAEQLLREAEAIRIDAGGLELSAAASAGGAFSQISPLAYRVESFTEHEASVELWGLAIVGGGAVDPPAASYSRDLVTVTWTDDGWRLAALEDVGDGPTPEPTQRDRATSTDRFLATLQDFREYRGGGL